ncbi:MAG: thiol-activated cytolysin family protein [Candidatus Pseudobacter hemicellulosilyticus]|uniref:Thiol-activated cytolysin family protein n=1 Tax=Candidatus Pseudobacter hemicellulosilyticus TaxID=3121375 RepID=A0AAJ5WVS4_9BACT|nr:MAG: thiol-activated cytolysin family protein [Pseudobacter sp.]
MKKTQLFLPMLLACALGGHAQVKSIQKTRADLLKVSSNPRLAWYASTLKKLSAKPKVTGTAVLGSKSDAAGNRTEIGVGLTGTESGFSANGSPRQEQNGNTVCTIQPYRVNFATSDNFNLFAASTPIYPGQFYNIASVLQGAFSSIPTPARKPYQLGINIFNANNPGPGMLNVTDLTRSPLPEIQRVLLAPNYSASIPASGVFDMVEIKSTMMLKAKYETSQGIFLPLQEFGIPAEVTAGFAASGSVSTQTNRSHYLVSFIQPMYTINVLTNHDQLFQSPNAHTSLSNAGYVESVTYGRRVSIIISSSSSVTRVKAAISAALSAEINGLEGADIDVGTSSNGETSVSLKEVASSFHATIYGGEGDMANRIFSDIVAFRDAFRNYIRSSSAGTFSATTGAMPLHYTLRRISDNALLTVRSTGSFDELVSCNTSKYKVEVLYDGFTVNKVLEFPPDDMEDIYGKFTLASVSTNGRTTSKDLLLKNIPKDRAISKKAGGRDSDDVQVVAMNNVSRNDLVNSILNFSQAMYDWELATAPAYRENSSAELKFNLADVQSDIDQLTPGSSKIFTKNIRLTESSALGESKITLHTRIKVTKN